MRKLLTSAIIIAVAAVTVMTGCKGILGLTKEAPPGAKEQAITFAGTAEVREDAPNVIRLNFAGVENNKLVEFSGFSGFRLKTPQGSVPAHVSTGTSPNGILGVTFDPDSPYTALLLMDGYVDIFDGISFVMTYDDSAHEIVLNDSQIMPFTVVVVNNVVSEISGKIQPDTSTNAPKVSKVEIRDGAPKDLRVEFDMPVAFPGTPGFALTVNGALRSEITGYTISGAGGVLTLHLKYGIGNGDSASLSYNKPDSVRSQSIKLIELEDFSMDIGNLVNQGTDPNGPNNPDSPSGPGGEADDPSDIPPGAPGAGAAISSLHVSLPRINWRQNENLKAAMTVMAVYSDSGTETLSPAEYTVNPASPTATVGENQIITVFYQGRTGSIAVNVVPEGTALPTLASLNVTVPRVSWVIGEKFLPNVTAVYSDSSVGTISSGYTLDPEAPTGAIKNDVTVKVSYTYEGVTKSGRVKINVVGSKNELPELTGISAGIEKKTWWQYEPFNAELTATYSDGTTGIIPYGYIFNPTTPTAVLGMGKSVLVSFKGRQAPALIINVVTKSEADNVKITAIIASPARPAWILEEPFEVVVSAVYSDGSEFVISSGYVLNPWDPTAKAGESIEVSATYKGKSDNFSIRVVADPSLLDPLSRVEITPNKTEYDYLEDYSMIVKAYYGANETGYPILSRYTLEPATITNTLGERKITATYGERGVKLSGEFTVTVKPIMIGRGGTGGDPAALYNLSYYIEKAAKDAVPDTAQASDANEYYTVNSITWYRTGESVPFTGGVFEAGTKFSANVELEAKYGYTFLNVAQNVFTHIDKDAGVSPNPTNATGTGTVINVTIDFPETAKKMIGGNEGGGAAALDLTPYVDKPLFDGAPRATTGDNASDYYKIKSVKWYTVAENGSSSAFAGAKFLTAEVYKAELELEAKTGFTFEGVSSGNFVHADKDGTVNPNPAIIGDVGDSVKVSVTFSETGSRQITGDTILDLTSFVDQPVKDGTPDIAKESDKNTCYAVTSITWQTAAGAAVAAGAKFDAGMAYKATVELKANRGFTFVGIGENVFTHANRDADENLAPNPANKESSGKVTIVFPKTASRIIGSSEGGGASALDLTKFVDAPVFDTAVGKVKASPVSDYFNVKSIVWQNADGTAYSAATFGTVSVYKAVVTLEAKQGYTFTGVPENAFRHDGKDASLTHNPSNAVNTGVVTITFPATGSRIIGSSPNGGGAAALDLTQYVEVPVKGAAPDAAKGTDTNEYFTVSTITWENATSNHSPFSGAAFASVTSYSAVVTLTAKRGYTFAGMAANSFTHSGRDGTVTPPNPETSGTPGATAKVIITFPETGSVIITSNFNLTQYVDQPVKNGVPDVAIPANDKNEFYTVSSITWKAGGAAFTGQTFAAATAYTAVVELTANKGFTFAGIAANVFTHDKKDTSVTPNPTNSKDTALVTIVFPKTANKIIGSSEGGTAAALDLTNYVDVPVIDGARGIVKASPTNSYFSVESIAWQTAAGASFNAATYEAATSYKAVVTLKAKDTYTFEGVAANAFKHSGASGTPASSAGTGLSIVVTITFPATADRLIGSSPKGGNATIMNLTNYVDMPVRTATPDTANGADINTYFKINSITWESAPGVPFIGSTFAGDVSYRAIVTLAAQAGYTFNGISGSAFTHAKASGTPSNTTGNASTTVVTITFPATVSGLIGSLPDGGGPTIMDLTEYVDMPVRLGTPDKETGADVNTFFKVSSITWESSPGVPFSGTQFMGAVSYRAIVTLTAQAGYTFNGISGSAFKHEKASGTPGNTTGNASTTVVTITFPATASGIIGTSPDGGGSAIMNLTEYIDLPVRGAAPDTAKGTDINTYFKVSTITWESAPGVAFAGSAFAGNVSYRAIVTLTAQTNYTFTGISGSAFKHEKASGTPSNTTDSGTTTKVTITFPATAKGVVSDIGLNLTPYITAPVKGKAPDTVQPSDTNEQWSVKSITWKVGPTVFAGAKFNASTAYTAVVVLDATSAYTFQGVAQNSYRHTATGAVVTNSANSGTATIAFPATASPVVKFIPNSEGASWISTGTGTYGSWTGSASKSVTVNAGESITLPTAANIQRSGYILLSWSLDSSGTSTNYALGSMYLAPSTDTSLYAFWYDPVLVNREAAEKAIKAANDALAMVAQVAIIKIGDPNTNNAAADAIRNQIELLQTFLAGTLVDAGANVSESAAPMMVTQYDNASIERETDKLIELVNAYQGGVIILASGSFQFTGAKQTAILVTAGGTYEFELKGAGGGHVYTKNRDTAPGGRGGHVKARYKLLSETNVDVMVGGAGIGNSVLDTTTMTITKDPVIEHTWQAHAGGWNGGGGGGTVADGHKDGGYTAGASGGGASDIRISGGTTLTASTSTDPRFAVAAGGGGAAMAADVHTANFGGDAGKPGFSLDGTPPQPGVTTNGVGQTGVAGSTDHKWEGRGGGGGGWKGGGAITAGSSSLPTSSGAGGTNQPKGNMNGKLIWLSTNTDVVIGDNFWGDGSVTIKWIE